MTEVIGDVAVVLLPGPTLDLQNFNTFKTAMLPVIAGHKDIVLDMRAVQFVDSSGVGAILSCLRRVHERQGEMRLCDPTRPVRALLQLVRIHMVLDVCNTRDDAIAHFAA